jgi:hypothetical protein
MRCCHCAQIDVGGAVVTKSLALKQPDMVNRKWPREASYRPARFGVETFPMPTGIPRKLVPSREAGMAQ